jgi:hypothetical protein
MCFGIFLAMTAELCKENIHVSFEIKLNDDANAREDLLQLHVMLQNNKTYKNLKQNI